MKSKRLYSGLMALGLACTLIFQTPVLAAEETAETQTSSISTNSISGWPQGPDITSTAAMIMEDSTQTTVYAKNMDQVLYPGATVKVMTTLLTLENAQLSDQVTMTATGVSGVTDGGASISAQLDEVFTVEQCLYAIMLASANDVALQIAEQIGGSVDGFVQMMNNRAVELGCTNTVFTNPTGLPDENQHTTAHDMALITKAAIDNESFRAIAETTSYTIPATNVSGGERVILQGASGTTAAEAVSLLNYGFDNFQLLSLGDNDFDMASGGNVFVPNGTTADALTTQDGEVQDGQYNRQFLFNGTPVGTAVMSVTSPEEDTAVIEASTQNLTNAQDYTVSHTSVPYFVIGGIGLLLLLLILFRIVKVAKS